jgi:hypothetical protein
MIASRIREDFQQIGMSEGDFREHYLAPFDLNTPPSAKFLSTPILPRDSI